MLAASTTHVCSNRSVMARAAAGCLLSLVGMGLLLSFTITSSGEEDIRAEGERDAGKGEYSALGRRECCEYHY